MTTPYGVTERGISDQIRKDGHVAGMDDKAEAAAYMRDKIVLGLEQTVVSAKQIMAWLQTVASKLSAAGVPFRFTTPCGSTVQQTYYQLKKHQVHTLVGKLVVWHEDKVGGLNDRKQLLASAPNVIHSFDAAHMTKTILRMQREAEALGEEISWSVIHDSYGVHACDVDLLHRCIREEFVAIYRENWLQKIEDEVRAYAPDVKIPSYTEFVTLGDFDIEEVTRSPFFFA
jgi:DNA-directed RNA polymerase